MDWNWFLWVVGINITLMIVFYFLRFKMMELYFKITTGRHELWNKGFKYGEKLADRKKK